MPRKSKVYSITDDEFRQLIASVHTYSDCLRALDLSTNGGSSLDVLKRRIKELNCSIEHFNEKVPRTKSYSAKYDLDEILIENSPYANISSLKRRLINEGRMEYKCAICGISNWNEKPLSLQLDHINGIHDDHRIENLRLLCPNCHSQTDTYAGKNK